MQAQTYYPCLSNQPDGQKTRRVAGLVSDQNGHTSMNFSSHSASSSSMSSVIWSIQRIMSLFLGYDLKKINSLLRNLAYPRFGHAERVRDFREQCAVNILQREDVELN